MKKPTKADLIAEANARYDEANLAVYTAPDMESRAEAIRDRLAAYVARQAAEAMEDV